MAIPAKRILRLFWWLLIVLAAFPIVLGGLIWWQKDKVIAFVVAKLNERLRTPVRVDKIDLTFWSTFPQMSVQMDSVIIQESVTGSTARLTSLGRLRLGFSPWAVFRGNYRIQNLEIAGAIIHMRHLADGTTNYNILKPSTDTSSTSASAFSLEHIWLDSIRFRFTDESPSGTHIALRLPHGDASLVTERNQTIVSLTTRGAELRRLIVAGQKIAEALPIQLAQTLVIQNDKQLIFQPSTLRLGNADYDVSGTVGLGKRQNQYRFDIQNRGSALAALSILLPPTVRAEIDKYHTQGQVFFKGFVQATAKGFTYPHIEASFGTKKARFQHTGYNLAFTGVNLQGDFRLSEGNSLANGSLRIQNASGSVAGNPLTASLEMQNLANPNTKGFLKAKVPLALFTNQLKEAGVVNPTGTVDLDLQFRSGPTKNMAEGSVLLDDLGFQAGSRQLVFAHWKGKLALRGEVLTAQALSGQIGRSDLAIEGRLEHLLGFLSGKKPKLGLDVALKSRFIDLDELLLVSTLAPQKVAAAAKAGADQNYRFEIAPGLRLNASCNVQQLAFRRFSPRNIEGDIEISGQQIAFDNFRFNEVGGRFHLSGTMDARKEEMSVQSLFDLENVRMDSLFYVMEDFNQKTLKHTQIQGRLKANGNISFLMNHALEVDAPSVVAAAKIVLTDGTLLYFEPAQALGRFIDKEELKYLKFSALENTFTIQNEVVTIPEMDIRANVFRCYVRGTHTFKQDMDYHLRIPTKYIHKSSLEAGGPELGGNLLLTLKGRVPNLKIGYDFAALKDKLKHDVQEEKENFLNLFRRKPKPVVPPPTTQGEDPQPETKDEPKFLDLD